MGHVSAHCLACGRPAPVVGVIACPACGGCLGFAYTDGEVRPDDGQDGPLWRWWRRLPVVDPRHFATLGEGGTPLLRPRLSYPVDLRLKDEGRNPTGSHKDRALAVAIAAALAAGVRDSVVVSAGSTGLSHAAYCARAGVRSTVLMSADADPGRARLLCTYGARVVRVAAPIDPVIGAVEALARERGLHTASTTRSSNPHQAEGCKTIAYELIERLGRAPDAVLVPTGGGGTIAALGRGFAELAEAGAIASIPRLIAIVPERWNALELALEHGLDDGAGIAALDFAAAPPTILGKLCHAHPPDARAALASIRGSGGSVIGVSDAEALAGCERLAREEGLFVEPSSGVVLPALERLLADGRIRKGEQVAALLCGSGFRELPFLPPAAEAPPDPVPLERLPALLLGNELITGG